MRLDTHIPRSCMFINRGFPLANCTKPISRTLNKSVVTQAYISWFNDTIIAPKVMRRRSCCCFWEYHDKSVGKSNIFILLYTHWLYTCTDHRSKSRAFKSFDSDLPRIGRFSAVLCVRIALILCETEICGFRRLVSHFKGHTSKDIGIVGFVESENRFVRALESKETLSRRSKSDPWYWTTMLSILIFSVMILMCTIQWEGGGRNRSLKKGKCLRIHDVSLCTML